MAWHLPGPAAGGAQAFTARRQAPDHGSIPSADDRGAAPAVLARALRLPVDVAVLVDF